MLRNRFLTALGFALVVGTFLAAPASATSCSGVCGSFSVTDTTSKKGAICKYETGSYDLDWISVRPPKMFGPYASMTKVTWYFKIYRSKDFGSSWQTAFVSTEQVAMASNTSAASLGNGFTRRTWNAPDPNPTGWFKLGVIMRWKNAANNYIGSNGPIYYHHYMGQWNGFTDSRTDYCLQDW